MKPGTRIADLTALPGPVVLAIGVFDGVHPGHRAVIERALAGARELRGTAVVVTFDPHPARVLRPDKAPHLLTSTPHKLRLIQQLGVEHILVLPFTKEFAATPPEDFLRELAAAAKPLRAICVGHEWAFGKNRTGNLALIARLGAELNFAEVGVPAVEIDGETVSSTLIRRAIEAGNLARAARLLGRRYAILGTVIRGQQLGRQLGFPTANLAAHNEQFPPNGVYVVETCIDGQTYLGAANLGTRPTLANTCGERLLEVHFLDFHGDLYERELEVTFCQYLRPEQKFPTLEALRQQISGDLAAVRSCATLEPGSAWCTLQGSNL